MTTVGTQNWIITAGTTYLDIDAYACMVAMRELLALQGQKAIAYSSAPCNYSVCQSLVAEGQLANSLPPEFRTKNAKYIIVDVSDPEYIKAAVPLDQVTAVRTPVLKNATIGPERTSVSR